MEHLADQSQDGLGTDLQLGWADIAAGDLAEDRPRAGSQEEEAARRRHTWAGADRHRARQCGQEQRPVSGLRRG